MKGGKVVLGIRDGQLRLTRLKRALAEAAEQVPLFKQEDAE